MEADEGGERDEKCITGVDEDDESDESDEGITRAIRVNRATWASLGLFGCIRAHQGVSSV